MLQKRIIPCLLLKENYFVKTIQFKNPNHLCEPIYAIKIFNDYEVDELIIVDITASRNPSNQKLIKTKIPFELISKISDESCMPITYGGGIKSLDEMYNLFKAGIEKICINSHAILDNNFIKQAVTEFGSQSVVISVDVKHHANGTYEIYTNCGQTPTTLNPDQYIKKMESLGVGEILLNSIDHDGMMNGYDIPLIQLISKNIKIPLIALGGAANLNDLSIALHEGGASAAAAGSIFVYYGKNKSVLINFPEPIEIEEIKNGKIILL